MYSNSPAYLYNNNHIIIIIIIDNDDDDDDDNNNNHSSAPIAIACVTAATAINARNQ